MGSLIGGESPIADLSGPLRALVKQGRVLFWQYMLTIKADKTNRVSASRWGWGRRTRRMVVYIGVLNWVKQPASEMDYGVDYEIMLWQ
jgi:hypothetical protein